MMISEFIEMTGFEPSMDEYTEIEQQYYEFDGDKKAFCKDFIQNGGIQKVYDKRLTTIQQLRSTMIETEKSLMQTIKEKETRIARLEADLEREQEWKPWVNEKALTQNQYNALADDSTSHEMTDEEAKEWISSEFGFTPERIRINRTMKVFEVSRHHQLRKIGEIDRKPFYDATDWYYVFFTVCGMDYEAYNGSLTQL